MASLPSEPDKHDYPWDFRIDRDGNVTVSPTQSVKWVEANAPGILPVSYGQYARCLD